MRMKKMGFFNPEKNTIKNEKKIQTNKKPKQTKKKYCVSEPLYNTGILVIKHDEL